MGKETKQDLLYKITEQKLRSMIFGQEYFEGKPLPPENELASALDVSRVTLRKAMGLLLKDGLIVRVRGKGTFVRRAGAGAAAHGNPRLVGVLLPTLDSWHAVQLLQGIEQTLSDNGYHAAIGLSGHNREAESRILDEFRELGVCGMLIYPSQHEKYNESILRLVLQRFPVVMVDRYLKGIDAPCVCSDNWDGAYRAAAHLLELGHKKIAYITSPADGATSLEDRLAGYERAMADHQVPIDRRLCLSEQNGQPEADAASIAGFLVANRDVTAVIAAEPELGTAAFEAARRCGLAIPGSLSVIQFDERSLVGSCLAQGTFVRQDGALLGRTAAEQILKIIGSSAATPEKIVVPVDLVERGSTAPPK